MWDWDEGKRAVNLAKHGVDLADIALMDWAAAEHKQDDRRDYGEQRYATTGFIGDRLHIATWTPRHGRFRVINLRKANAREQREYRIARAAH